MKLLNEYAFETVYRFLRMPFAIVIATFAIYGAYLLMGYADDFQKEYDAVVENPQSLIPFVSVAVLVMVIINILEGVAMYADKGTVACSIVASMLCLPLATWYLSSNPSVEDIVIRSLLFYLLSFALQRIINALYANGTLTGKKGVAWYVSDGEVRDDGEIVIKKKQLMFVDIDLVPQHFLETLNITGEYGEEGAE